MSNENRSYTSYEVSQIIRKRVNAANKRAETLEIEKATLEYELDQLRGDAEEQPEQKAGKFDWLGKQHRERRKKGSITR